MSKKLTEYRWVLIYGPENSLTIEPAENGCRDYECCGGSGCGFSIYQAQQSMIDHYQRQADRLSEMAPEEFLKDQGYFEDGSE